MSAWWPRAAPARRAGLAARPGPAAPLRRGHLLRTPQIDVLAARRSPRFDPDDLSVEDIALLDELGELLGEPPVRAGRARDPFHVVDGVHELSTTSRAGGGGARGWPTERPADYREYAHIVVDEAQDVSPMQWRMIGRRGEYASWTIVGDPAQAAWPDQAEAARAMTEAVGRRRARVRADHQLPQRGRDLRRGRAR